MYMPFFEYPIGEFLYFLSLEVEIVFVAVFS